MKKSTLISNVIYTLPVALFLVGAHLIFFKAISTNKIMSSQVRASQVEKKTYDKSHQMRKNSTEKQNTQASHGGLYETKAYSKQGLEYSEKQVQRKEITLNRTVNVKVNRVSASVEPEIKLEDEGLDALIELGPKVKDFCLSTQSKKHCDLEKEIGRYLNQEVTEVRGLFELTCELFQKNCEIVEITESNLENAEAFCQQDANPELCIEDFLANPPHDFCHIGRSVFALEQRMPIGS